MTLGDVAKTLSCRIACGTDQLNREVHGGYASDLLSDVIAHAQPGMVWITLQVHLNIVAVAVLKDLAGIIVVQGRSPAEDTLAKATEEKIPILVSPHPAFQTAGMLFSTGIGGGK